MTKFLKFMARWSAGAGCVMAAFTAPAATLPQEHAYQRTLRAYLAELTVDDFSLDRPPFRVSPGEKTDSERYRFHLLGVFPVSVRAGVRLPPESFTLDSIETPDGIRMPAIAGKQSGVFHLAWLIGWDYPGNPYYGSRALKRRAFAVAAVDMILHDHAHEVEGIGRRSDFLGGTLIWLASAYREVRDILPAEVRDAYETGLEKFVRRLDEWGPRGAMVDMDLFAAVSLPMTADLLDDPEISAIAETYVKRLFTESKYFHPAGYFVDGGCFDTSYNGISLYFAVWAALRAPQWTFIQDALDKAYKLKGHLTFPEPDGRAFGPSSMSSRTSACPPHDQWDFYPRNVAAAMLTDHALFLPSIPAPENLTDAEERLVERLNRDLGREWTAPDDHPWREAHWGPRPNYAYDFYRPEFYERLVELVERKDPRLENPFLREDDFIETFEEAFLIGKLGDYAFALHTGPVGRNPMFGWGGGALCAFWSRDTGSVMLGRRRGWARQTGLGERADSFETWRMWPVHAVTGMTPEGNIFSSSRILDPNPEYTVGDERAAVTVSGRIPRRPTNTSEPCLEGEVTYARRFDAGPAGLSIETLISSDGRDKAVELYETLPVFLREARSQAHVPPTEIRFRDDTGWSEATADFHEGVTEIRLDRFAGAVKIAFDRPQRVKLSPAVWSDHYQSRVTCRTILIDLLGSDGDAVPIPETSLRYTLSVLTDAERTGGNDLPPAGESPSE